MKAADKLSQEIVERKKNMTADELKDKLLEEAKRKKVRRFVQYDVFFKDFDDVIRPNDEGLSIWCGVNDDLRNTDCIRLTFTPDTDINIVLKALKQLIDYIEDDVKQGYKEGLQHLYIRPKDRVDNEIPF